MKKLFYIFAISLCCSACRKENNASDFQGSYVGTFIVKSPEQSTRTATTLKLSSPSFEVTEGLKLGSGTFTVEDRSTVTFADTNSWTADFDWNLILNGTYAYQTLGDSLILTKRITTANNLNQYQYRLKRVID